MRLEFLTALVLLTGCAGAPEEEGAERAVERQTRADAECTGRSRIWFQEGPAAKVLLCVAHTGDGLCDRYRVDREGTTYRLRVLERGGSCTLPVG